MRIPHDPSHSGHRCITPLAALLTALLAAAIAAITLRPAALTAQDTDPAGPVAGGAPTTPATRPAGQDTATVEVVLADGSVLYGHVLQQDSTTLRLELLSGDVIELRRSRLRDIRPLTGRVVEGEIWRADPNATRLFFAPTGRSLASGHGYISVYELVIPFLAVGVSDRFTVSGGTPLVFGGEGDRIFWLAPKLQVVRRDRLAAAIGALHFFSTGGEGSAGIAYGVGTFGGADNAVTVGLGYGYAEGDLSDQPVIMVGGEARGSRTMKLITENYFVPGEGALVSGGFRFFGERLTADLGLVVPTGTDETVAFPLVNFVYNWGPGPRTDQ